MSVEQRRSATASEIREVVGDVDDSVVSRIIRTDATAAEVLLAVSWLRGAGLDEEGGHEPHGAARTVYDILVAEEPPDPN